MNHRSTCSLIAILVFPACGPIYSSDYRFTPPPGARGGQCIDECKEIREACNETRTAHKEDCERENERLVERCNDRIAREKNRGPKWTECGRQIACDYPESYCEEKYRGCYASCGGTVVEERVCVANCGE